MAGGLLQLVAYGEQDVILTGNPTALLNPLKMCSMVLLVLETV